MSTLAKRILLAAHLALAASGTASIPAHGADFSPGPPVDCTLGADCFVQNRVDRAPGPEALDYRCGRQTYDAHKGVDVRLPDLAAMRRGVDVLAVAPGRVLRARDGERDVSFRTLGREAVRGRECGNALVIDHGDGWTTQACHLKRGSLRVAPGDVVEAGRPLAEIGLSGFTEFPHLHLSFRKDGRIVDPLDPAGIDATLEDGACDAAPAETSRALWRGDAWAYREAVILNAGFADRRVDMAMIEEGGLAAPDRTSGVMIVYARVINRRDEDVTRITLTGPGGRTLARHEGEPGGRAQSFVFAGVRAPETGLIPGAYRASIEVVRKGDGHEGDGHEGDGHETVVSERTITHIVP